jgi:hypothetical protein
MVCGVMKPSSEYQLYTAQTRLDLWDALKDTNHPLNMAWPRFLENDLSQQHFSDTILKYSGLRKFQFAIVEPDPTGGETMIACGRSIPFFWPELEEVRDIGGPSVYPHVLSSLPDGGWDTIVSRGIRQYFIREGLSLSSLPILTRDQEQDWMTCQTANKPNALSALSITVRADRRRLGLAERLIEIMKQTAQEEHLQVLVAPLRPTRKSEFPFIQMQNYVNWTQTKAAIPSNLATLSSSRLEESSPKAGDGHAPRQELLFDPWLRKHIWLGGRILKIAPSSMVVQGSVTEWQAWTGIDFHHLLRESHSRDLKREQDSNRMYLEIPIPGGLVPLRVYVTEKTCTYIEPNVWLYHQVC